MKKRTPHEALKAWRTAARLSQREVAARLGVGQTTVSHWERGDRVPRTALAVALEEMTKRGIEVAAWPRTAGGRTNA